MQDAHDPAVVSDVYDQRREVLDGNDATDIALYGAIVEQGRSARSVAMQAGMKTEEAKRRAKYIRRQMQDALGDAYEEIVG